MNENKRQQQQQKIHINYLLNKAEEKICFLPLNRNTIFMHLNNKLFRLSWWFQIAVLATVVSLFFFSSYILSEGIKLKNK